MKSSTVCLLTLLGTCLGALSFAQSNQAEMNDPAFIEFYQEQKQRLGPGSPEITLRVFVTKDTLRGRRTMHVGDLGGRNESRLRLTVDPGDYQFIVIAEEPEFLSKPRATRTLDRLQPNVSLTAYEMKTTRVRIGTVGNGGGFDTRSGSNVGAREAQRYAQRQNDIPDNNPITSGTSPSATQFSTVIIVEEPKLTEAEKKR